jgi:succinate dehydrogenase/fumarate reductase flavoprotein subunit
LNGIILKNGEILLKTKFCDLIANASGRVTGIKAIQENGAPLTVTARKAVILATGGFACNKEMVTRYFGPHADLSAQRTVPYNDGTGILTAVRLGAMLSRSMTSFYGHMQPFPTLLPQTPEEYEVFDRDLFRSIGGSMQGFTTRAVIVNQDGLRFVDESTGDEEVVQIVLRQKHAICWVILDSRATNAGVMKSLETYKAVIVTGNTIEELAGKIGEYGVSAPHLIQTLNDYNKAVQEKGAAKLSPPRGGNPAEMATAPFYGIQATGGISATYGGLAINEKCQVLGAARIPIPGLYAAPHAAGGIFYESYAGSLAVCTTFGRLAGKYATAAATA